MERRKKQRDHLTYGFEFGDMLLAGTLYRPNTRINATDSVYVLQVCPFGLDRVYYSIKIWGIYSSKFANHALCNEKN